MRNSVPGLGNWYKCAEIDANLTTGCQTEIVARLNDYVSAGSYTVCYCKNENDCNAANGLKAAAGVAAILAVAVLKLTLV